MEEKENFSVSFQKVPALGKTRVSINPIWICVKSDPILNRLFIIKKYDTALFIFYFFGFFKYLWNMTQIIFWFFQIWHSFIFYFQWNTWSTLQFT